MNTVAGDVCALQSLSQLVSEQDVTEFAVAVGLEELPAVSPWAQVFGGDKRIKINIAPAMGHGG